MSTVTTTVAPIITSSLVGIRLMVAGAMECQSKVAIDTMIISATRAAIGILATISPRSTTRISRNTPCGEGR